MEESILKGEKHETNITVNICCADCFFVQLGMVKELKVTGCRRHFLNGL